MFPINRNANLLLYFHMYVYAIDNIYNIFIGDFKPASVDANKMASVEVGTNNQVTVTVPHLG